MTADAPDSLLLDELDSLDDALLPEELDPLEDEPLEVSEPVVGVLDVSEPLEPLDVPAAEDPVVEVPEAAAAFAAACLAAARLAASFSAALTAALFAAVELPEDAVPVTAAAALVLVERAGSCPDASCT